MSRLLAISYLGSSLLAVACTVSTGDDSPPITDDETQSVIRSGPNGQVALSFLDTSDEPQNPGDWDPCRGKASCAPGGAVIGLSELPGGPGRTALCKNMGAPFSWNSPTVISLDGNTDVRRSKHMPDWAPNYFKLECGANEFVLGVSENASNAQCQRNNNFHALRCAAATSALSNDCHVRTFDLQDDRGKSDWADWDPNAFKGECGVNQYMAGVSVDPNTRRPHSMLCCNTQPGGDPFVRRSGRDFMLYGAKFKHTTANMQALIFETPAQQRTDLDGLAADGVREVRVLISNSLLSKEQIGDRLSRTIELARARAIKITVVLTGNYGGADSHYVLWTPPGDPDYGPFKDHGFKYIAGDQVYLEHPSELFGDTWLNGGYTVNYKPFAEYIVSRFRDEPTIMAWEVTGEIFSYPSFNIPLLTNFYLTMARDIKRLDPNHLVTPGIISTQQVGMTNTDVQYAFFNDNSIDYISAHSYDDDNRDDSAIAARVTKPYVIAEFGFELYDPTSWYNRVNTYLTMTYKNESAQSVGFWAVEYGTPKGDGDRKYSDGRNPMTSRLYREWLGKLY